MGGENNLLIAQGKAKLEDEDENEDETGNLIRFYNSSLSLLCVQTDEKQKRNSTRKEEPPFGERTFIVAASTLPFPSAIPPSAAPLVAPSLVTPAVPPPLLSLPVPSPVPSLIPSPVPSLVPPLLSPSVPSLVPPLFSPSVPSPAAPSAPLASSLPCHVDICFGPVRLTLCRCFFICMCNNNNSRGGREGSEGACRHGCVNNVAGKAQQFLRLTFAMRIIAV